MFSVAFRPHDCRRMPGIQSHIPRVIYRTLGQTKHQSLNPLPMSAIWSTSGKSPILKAISLRRDWKSFRAADIFLPTLRRFYLSTGIFFVSRIEFLTRTLYLMQRERPLWRDMTGLKRFRNMSPNPNKRLHLVHLQFVSALNSGRWPFPLIRTDVAWQPEIIIRPKLGPEYNNVDVRLRSRCCYSYTRLHRVTKKRSSNFIAFNLIHHLPYSH